MRIDRLLLENFRNYEAQEVLFHPDCNVIYGENAEGKTNLLEAILYLSSGRSPRTRADRELIRFDQPAARLNGGVVARQREFTMDIRLFRGQRRRMTVNQVPAKTASSLSEVFQTVFFCPDDLSLIRDGAAARRRFLDTALCQLRPRYAAALSEYNRAYEQKTRILRDSEEKPTLLEALPEFSERMVRCGAVVIDYRARYIERLSEYATANHQECSGGKETLTLSYQTVSSIEDTHSGVSEIEARLREHMERHRQAELASRLCLSGPHKDDLAVQINGQDARSFSSQGQTRTAALALKLAEREILKNATGEYPILLLDDVLSELDTRRQEFVLNRIPGGQVFITCCEDDRLAKMLGGKVFHVAAGTVTP